MHDSTRWRVYDKEKFSSAEWELTPAACTCPLAVDHPQQTFPHTNVYNNA